MGNPSTAARWIATAAMLLASMPSTHAQRGQPEPTEDRLRSRIAAQPQQLPPYLDLASFYYSQGRFDDFDRTLNAALEMVRQSQARAGAADAPPAQTPTEQPRRVGAGTGIAVPAKLREVRPVYPPDALQQGIGGIVILEVTIDSSGLVSNARVTQSVAGLDEAALAAVRQWEFVPSFQNGSVVPVIMDVRLTFLPEMIVRVPQSSRRQIPAVLSAARRLFDNRAYGEAAHLLNVALMASERDRAQPLMTVGAVTNGVTTSDWPIRGGRDLRFPARTKDAKVIYPPDAKQTGVGGLVTFDFVIDEQGKAIDLRQTATSDPVLGQAARDAIQQWEYAPTMVAGAPVPVAMMVTFAFQADRGEVEEVQRVGGEGEITPPKKIKHVPPRYPSNAQRGRAQGAVWIEAVIDRDGKVGSARIVRSAGDILDKAALEAVSQWEFTPSKLYGVPVAVVMRVTMSFFVE